MAYRLEATEPVQDGIRRIASEQVSKAIGEIDDENLDDHETVHQVRKRCKKARGLLRLVRPGLGKTYSRQNRKFRDAARSLSPIRDAEAVIGTFDELIEIYGDLIDQRRFRSIRTAFEHRRSEVEGEFAIDEQLAEFRGFCEDQLVAIDEWELDGDGAPAIVGGLVKTYARGYSEFEEALDSTTSEAFHEWRKRVKYHWYHMRILRDVWPPVVRARRDELDRLSDILGDEHDLAVMQELIAPDPCAFAGYRTIQALFGLIERRRVELQHRTKVLGERVYAEDPAHFESRFKTYLEVWNRESQQDWVLH
ncbi:CHAD domain-containing protein [soil metagenome]